MQVLHPRRVFSLFASSEQELRTDTPAPSGRARERARRASPGGERKVPRRLALPTKSRPVRLRAKPVVELPFPSIRYFLLLGRRRWEGRCRRGRRRPTSRAATRASMRAAEGEKRRRRMPRRTMRRWDRTTAHADRGGEGEAAGSSAVASTVIAESVVGEAAAAAGGGAQRSMQRQEDQR